jgi:SAM-dependent methyltransferase
LTIEPNFADAHHNRGNALFKLGRYSEARISYRLALEFKPDLFEAARALVCLLLSESNFVEAVEVARHALTRNKSNEAKNLVVLCLCSPLANPNVDPRDLLLRSISEPWTRPVNMSSACARFLVLNDTIRNGLERIAKLASQSSSAEALIDPSATCISALGEDQLFCAMLELTPICDVLLERFVTGLRFQLLGAARSTAITEVSGPLLTIYCAIARQCFINNYVFDQADEEIERAMALRNTLISSIESGAAVPILSLIAVAAYFPLYSLPRAESLLDGQWPPVVKGLLAQQISAPIEEGKLRSSMPALTAINDGVSMQVRDQCEESPYPQWVKAAPGPNPVTVDEFITSKFPHSSFIKLKKHTGIDILVAGCGTGQHSIETAQRFKASQVLAIDLSMTSLCYANRQTHEIGLKNIQYAQADIMRLSTINRTFDVIEACGVLHHLADPFAGWSVLLSLLRPGGIMRLGLYSEIARRDIRVAREFIAQRGYRPIAEDIRRYRREIINSADDNAPKRMIMLTDFYSLNGCRDLLFNVQEEQLSLSKIAAFLFDNDLQFLGFEIDELIGWDYLRYFPADIAMTDLTLWHQYEVNNPSTFLGMYNFWTQKK